MKIYLNREGIKLYPWLASKGLDVFGYDFDKHCFLIWDDVVKEWLTVHQSFCCGEE